MADEKIKSVLDAALNVFIRYGFKRVTMGDIAKEAGMSRPALYLVFSNKEEIFRAVLLNYISCAASELRVGLGERVSVGDKLRFVFEVWSVRPYRMIHNAPDADELINCTHDFARDIVDGSKRTIEAILVDLIEPFGENLAVRGMTSSQLARVIGVSAHGFKRGVENVDELQSVIDSFVVMIEATLSRHQGV